MQTAAQRRVAIASGKTSNQIQAAPIPPSNQISPSINSVSNSSVSNQVESITHQINDLNLDTVSISSENQTKDSSNQLNTALMKSNIHRNIFESKVATQIVSPPAIVKVTNPSNEITKPSKTGLTNLGNSCFMSSVIQCLSNTRELRDFFIDGRFIADINSDNPLGFNGELAKCFYQVIRKLWSGEYESFPPRSLKSIISKRSENFGGYQQQDAHEFMSYLLDGLHEDLNRVKTKPVTAAVEGNGRPDVEVANDNWEVHKKRNDSFLVERFQGQFKSTLVCPICSKVGVANFPVIVIVIAHKYKYMYAHYYNYSYK